MIVRIALLAGTAAGGLALAATAPAHPHSDEGEQSAPRTAADICAPFMDADALYSRDAQARNIVVTGATRKMATEAMADSAAPPPPVRTLPAPPPVATTPVAPPPMVKIARPSPGLPGPENRERYDGHEVSRIARVADSPVSTFSVDVDTGSYANVRRMITHGTLPPSAAVRTEEMLNYFRYDYDRPADGDAPFSIASDMGVTPWNEDTRLLRIGLSGYDIPRDERPTANLVFLVDVSGSMRSMDKLPLVKCSLALTAERLRPQDRVAIVTYSGGTRVALTPTNDKQRVLDAIAGLYAGGSTAGAAAIELAYAEARKSYRDGQVNRILLATDGDFNVGVTDRGALIDMVEREREAGISLTALGYGTGNYNEAMMEQIADHGNGNYFYIDSANEAAKVLDEELAATLFTIAKDVKIQVEFNPAHVSEYRLIGYENRALAEEDFDNDAVDAGEIGAGHQVTALYELVPAGAKGWTPERRYAANKRPASDGDRNAEMAVVRLRYKLPDGDTSRLIEQTLPARMIARADRVRGDLAFAAAVAGYGQALRGDRYLNGWTVADSAKLAEKAGKGPYRREFIELARGAAELNKGG